VAETLTLEQQTARLLNHPYHRFAGLELVHQEAGKAWCRFEVNANSISLSATLHSGVLYGLLDATSHLALLPMLEPGEQASTIDLHVSIVRAVPPGARVALRAEVVRKRSKLAFLRCEAQTVEDAAGTVAVALITATISRRARCRSPYSERLGEPKTAPSEIAGKGPWHTTLSWQDSRGGCCRGSGV